LRIPVLTYHSANILQNSYAQNDHIALAGDLKALERLGWTILPLKDVVDWHQGEKKNLPADKLVALSFDDGSWFDYHDLDHPSCGMQRSFFNILLDCKNQAGKNQTHKNQTIGDGRSAPHATSFVITSPEARDELDKKGLIGRGWWGDEWWNSAQQSGLLDIECHSWDHVHPDLDRVAQQDQQKGDFGLVRAYADCEAQLTQSGAYIQQQMNGRRPTLFAYPWGQASDYIVDHYLPDFKHQHRFRAAFTTQAKPLEQSDNIWTLPRFVAGRDWDSPEGFEKLLADCS
jgi:peptidoglycan/xylan/chitin deacetylase (PgdA/CDA1 family)